MQYKNFINIQAYKYNGKLYRQWSGCKILEENSEHVIVNMNKKTKVMEKNYQKWTIREQVLWFFHKKHFFNALITIKNDCFYIYINLASPYFFEENTIKYIDFDLDIKVYPGKECNIIDQKEFFLNAKKMNYPNETIDLILDELKYVVGLYANGKYIFNKKYLREVKTKIEK
ncbi:DUF402 domain-containing protein [Mesomycoplasma molare]|uniref:DUF402 domain-containing protein n=1 Tax=Mesomycoplasma molare TaxID=171288 RepID=A0ABY5TW01_9BACT|nr:DUF402 domain-containing protein [Mesomycoplasma molare]UWD34171.1 DUF402 domain-containing protein [Mesomycoplasma molare]